MWTHSGNNCSHWPSVVNPETMSMQILNMNILLDLNDYDWYKWICKYLLIRAFISSQLDYCYQCTSPLCYQSVQPSAHKKTLLPGYWLGQWSMITFHRSWLPHAGYLLLLELILSRYWLQSPERPRLEILEQIFYCRISFPTWLL